MTQAERLRLCLSADPWCAVLDPCEACSLVLEAMILHVGDLALPPALALCEPRDVAVVDRAVEIFRDRLTTILRSERARARSEVAELLRRALETPPSSVATSLAPVDAVSPPGHVTADAALSAIAAQLAAPPVAGFDVEASAENVHPIATIEEVGPRLVFDPVSPPLSFSAPEGRDDPPRSGADANGGPRAEDTAAPTETGAEEGAATSTTKKRRTTNATNATNTRRQKNKRIPHG